LVLRGRGLTFGRKGNNSKGGGYRLLSEDIAAL